MRGFFVPGFRQRQVMETMERYDPQAIEAKWQQVWADEQSFHVPNPDPAELAGGERSKSFVVEMLPYPSGDLHMGHTLNYTIGDVITHTRRRQGMQVLRPMGYDAFGLPAENAAIKEGGHPARRHRAQYRRRSASRCTAWAGRSTGAARSRPHDPAYYRWTQWLFLRFFEKGLAYRKEAPVKWCPNDQTVLANEQVIDGHCERCGAEVEAQEPDAVVLPDHRLRRRAARRDGRCSRLARARPDDAAQLDRPLAGRRASSSASTGAGRSCRSSRPGRTRCSARRSSCWRPSTRWSRSSSPAPSTRRRCSTTSATPPPAPRSSGRTKEKDGVFTGRYAINPVNGERIPIWVADYVLMGYGTGAIMAVPAHDERDYAFARALRARDPPGRRAGRRRAARGGRVLGAHGGRGARQLGRVQRAAEPRGEGADRRLARRARPRRGDDRLPPARLAVLAAALLGLPDPDHPLRRCGEVPVPDDQLPVLLPDVEEYAPKGRSPLAAAEDWVNVDLPGVRRPGAARDGHDGHVRRLVLVLHPLHRPGQRRGAVRPRRRRLLAARQPVHRRHRARHAAPALRAVLHEGHERAGHVLVPRAVRAPVQPGDDRRATAPRCRSRRATSSTRSSTPTATAPTRCGCTRSSWARPTRTWTGRTTASRASGASSTGSGASRTSRRPLAARRARRRARSRARRIRRSPRSPTTSTAASRSTRPIAAVMELVNEIQRHPDDPAARFATETAVSLIQPYAPHVAEELWGVLGDERLWEQPWPEADPALLVHDVIEIAVQVNGKLRDRLQCRRPSRTTSSLALALASERVQALPERQGATEDGRRAGQARLPRRLGARARLARARRPRPTRAGVHVRLGSDSGTRSRHERRHESRARPCHIDDVSSIGFHAGTTAHSRWSRCSPCSRSSAAARRQRHGRGRRAAARARARRSALARRSRGRAPALVVARRRRRAARRARTGCRRELASPTRSSAPAAPTRAGRPHARQPRGAASPTAQQIVVPRALAPGAAAAVRGRGGGRRRRR